MTESPFVLAFVRFFDAMKRATDVLPVEGRARVRLFLRGTETALIAVVNASESVGDASPEMLRSAGIVVASVERMNLSHTDRVNVLATALVTMSDPNFEETFARAQARRRP